MKPRVQNGLPIGRHSVEGKETKRSNKTHSVKWDRNTLGANIVHMNSVYLIFRAYAAYIWYSALCI